MLITKTELLYIHKRRCMKCMRPLILDINYRNIYCWKCLYSFATMNWSKNYCKEMMLDEEVGLK